MFMFIMLLRFLYFTTSNSKLFLSKISRYYFDDVKNKITNTFTSEYQNLFIGIWHTNLFKMVYLRYIFMLYYQLTKNKYYHKLKSKVNRMNMKIKYIIIALIIIIIYNYE